MDVLDANMPQYIRQWLFAMSPVFTTMVLICYSTPIFAVVIVPVAILFVIAQVNVLSQISKSFQKIQTLIIPRPFINPLYGNTLHGHASH